MAETDVPSTLNELRPEAQYGRLPFDKFLVAWWDYTSFTSIFPLFDGLPEELQRAIQDLNAQLQVSKLRQLYIEGGWALRRHYFPDRRVSSDSSSPIPPLPSPLSTILPSLNTVQERNLVYESIRVSASRVLRTCYRTSAADKARHQWLLDEYAEWSTPPETFLDDASRYSFGSDYERMLELAPDLISGRVPYTVEQRIKEYIEVLQDRPPGSGIGGERLAKDNIVNWIQIEDKAFFDGEPVLLVYYDEYGKTCVGRREPHMSPALQFGAWFDGCWRDSLDFGGGEGEDYADNGKRTQQWEKRLRAEMMRLGKDKEVQRKWQARQEEEKKRGGRRSQYGSKTVR